MIGLHNTNRDDKDYDIKDNSDIDVHDNNNDADVAKKQKSDDIKKDNNNQHDYLLLC